MNITEGMSGCKHYSYSGFRGQSYMTIHLPGWADVFGFQAIQWGGAEFQGVNQSQGSKPLEGLSLPGALIPNLILTISHHLHHFKLFCSFLCTFLL